MCPKCKQWMLKGPEKDAIPYCVYLMCEDGKLNHEKAKHG